MSFEVEGDLRALIQDVQTLPEQLTTGLNHAWADEASRRLREYVGGGPVTSYLRMRSGAARDSVQATWNAQGASLSVSGPGMNFLEEGGTIRPRKGKYLTFRIREPWDGEQATGPWIRARQVKIPARHMVRDAAVQALDTLGDHLDFILGGLTA
ncbi:hypothetical protein [Deinococcus budaensis]|uniref:Uncharacterized protein n=1 Tax=Deinococcus budaensis TaxID=1665626 RepID=A0A7W8LQ56_9DEIO|nr:hypothetical protein [Deinococcus budaensis]MBB5234471.1 hypothetical protein [Deinococcus budaensis]